MYTPEQKTVPGPDRRPGADEDLQVLVLTGDVWFWSVVEESGGGGGSADDVGGERSLVRRSPGSDEAPLLE
jgi:hypothetical protein